MLYRSTIREPICRLTELNENCRDEIVFQLLRYNGDVNRLVYFMIDDDIVYISAASDQEFVVEKNQIVQAFDSFVELHCHG